VVGLDETRVTLEVVQMSAEAAGPLFDLAIIAPGLKQRGTETLAALCGELGIRRLFLTNLRRSVARVSAGKVARLTAVATEAARRVGQPSIPAIEVAATLEAAVAAVAGRPLYFLWEKGGLDVAELRLPEGGRAAFVLGTEGGFDPSETETLIRWGAIPLHLRGTAYTAVTAAAAGMILFLHKGGAL
jgi:16S rRNA (uracil1498-N3)-methyltransferase